MGKNKTKIIMHGDKKRSSSIKSLKSKQSSKRATFAPIIAKLFQSHHKKYWLLATAAILLIGIVWCLSQLLLVQSAFSQTKTYSKISVLGMNVGNLSADQLDIQLAHIKSEFETHKITLVNDKKQW